MLSDWQEKWGATRTRIAIMATSRRNYFGPSDWWWTPGCTTSGGQALGYKVGQLKLLALRESAKQQLGAKFDLRAFHDEVLAGGALPLDVLEEQVKAWVKSQQS